MNKNIKNIFHDSHNNHIYASSGDSVAIINLEEIKTPFTENNITLQNCTLTNFSGSGSNYSADLTPTLEDDNNDNNPDSNEVICEVTVKENEFEDSAGNGNKSASFTWTCDRRLPVVNSVSHRDDGNGYYKDVIHFNIEFDEQVTVSGSPTLTLTDDLIATAVSNTTLSHKVRFEYHITNDDDHHYTNVSIPASSTINLNVGDSIKDAHNNHAVLHVLETTTNIVIDNRQPEINNISVINLKNDATNNANVEVTFTSDKSPHYYDTASCVVVNDSNSTPYTVSVVSAVDDGNHHVDWTITIDTGVDDDKEKEFTDLKLQLIDKAGNNSNLEDGDIPAFTVDRVRPTVVIKTPVPQHTNNPTIRIESSKAGTAKLINNTSLKFENNAIKDGEVNELRVSRK